MIKKILSVFAIAAGLVSCNGEYDDWASVQKNAQAELDNITFSTDYADVKEINLADASDSLRLFTPVFTGIDNPVVTYNIIFGDDQKSKELLDETDNAMTKAELQALVEDLFGKRPVANSLNMRVTANISKNGVVYQKQSSQDLKLQITPEAPYIAEAYYMVGDAMGWNEEGALASKFTHSDQDVYADPYFTLVFTTTKDNSYWKIIPADYIGIGNIWGEKVVGTKLDGDPSLEGSLVNTDAKAGVIEKAGKYRMTINMMDYSYTITPLASTYYLVGTPNGWAGDVKKSSFYPNEDGTQEYTTNWTGAWDCKAWSADDFGNWDKCIGTAIDGDGAASGSLVTSGAGCLQSPEAGYWTLTIDFAALTYKWTKLADQNPAEYSAISLIGDYNGWNGDTELNMTQANTHNWYYLDLSIASKGGIKFRANHDWGINWGTGVDLDEKNYGTGVGNGDNISVPEGTYDVYFNDITGKFTFIKK